MRTFPLLDILVAWTDDTARLRNIPSPSCCISIVQKLSKIAVQNGKKVTSRIDFELVSNASVTAHGSKKDDARPTFQTTGSSS